MAKKEVRISINKLEATMVDPVIKVQHGDIEITIRRSLTLKDMLQFVEDVVSSCVDVTENTYTPEVKQFAINAAVLTKYANFNLPSNAEKQYDLIYNTDVLRTVMAHINQDQFDEILEAIDNRIEYSLEIMENVVAARANDLVAKFEEMVTQYESLFDGLSDVDVGSVVRNISRMEKVDEAALAHAVLDAQGKYVSKKGNSDTRVVPFPGKTDL